MFERGPYVSFANCGLPYYIGDVIQKEDKLLVATAELFKNRFNIEVRNESEVVAINREGREIQVHNLQTGASYWEQYDALVLAPGAAPLRPPLPGIDLPGIFTLRTIPDSRDIRQWIAERRRSDSGCRGRWIHRTRNDGEPGAAWPDRHCDRDDGSGAAATRPGIGGSGAPASCR